jgi:predicted amidohydrolase YtcJ
VHAVGDLALDMALDAFETAIRERPRADHRHRIEHMGNYGLTSERVARAKALGLAAVPNPSSLHYLSARTIDSYGADRLGRQYPFKWLSGQGLSFALASDGGGLWPVDPLRDIGTCVTRETYDGSVLDAGETLDVAEALRAYTSYAAWTGFGESKFGTIEVGKRADLAVLSADPLEAAPEDIARIGVEATLLDGRVTHDAGGLSLVHP